MLLKLRRMVEDWLGVAPAAPGEDTQWAFRLPMAWPDWVLLLFAAAAALYVVAVTLREGQTRRGVKLLLAGLRLGAIALLVLMLGEWELTIDRTGLPDLVVAVDDSLSMGHRDRDLPGPSGAAAGTEGAQSPTSPTALTPPTRLERAVGFLAADDGRRLAGLVSRHKPHGYAIATTPVELRTAATKPAEVAELVERLKALKPRENSESLLGDCLRGILNDSRTRPPAAILLLTDGVTTRGETLLAAAGFAKRKQVPIYAIGVGDPAQPKDLELADLRVDDTVFVGADVVFTATLSGRGYAGQTVTVSLKGEGIDGALTQTVTVPKDGATAPVQIVYRPRKEPPQKTGTFTYTLELPPQPQEANLDNNRLEKPVTVVDEKIRVLLVDTMPRYEFRYVKSLLERQPTCELQVVLLDADREFSEQDRSALRFLPTNADDLAKFDVLIFGDLKPSFLSQTQQQAVVDYVKKGGGFMAVAGPRFTPHAWRDTLLEPLLPVKLPAGGGESGGNRAFRPRLTALGRKAPNLHFEPSDDENAKVWAALPPMFTYASVEEKPAAGSLLEHPDAERDGKPVPLAATQSLRGGRTYYQGFDGTWRWRFRLGDQYHAQYWLQTVQYLCESKRLGKNRLAELTVDRKQYRRGEPARIRLRFRDEGRAPKPGEPVAVVVTRENAADGRGRASVALERVPGEPGSFEGLFTQTEDGRHVVRWQSLEADAPPQRAEFRVLPPPGEADTTQMNETELEQVAKLTGGRYFRLADAEPLWGLLPPGRQVAIQTVEPIALWRTWAMLLLFVGLLGVEWIVRKAHQLS